MRDTMRHKDGSRCGDRSKCRRAHLMALEATDEVVDVFVGKFTRLVEQARRAGVAVVVDAETPAIRLMTAAVHEAANDLRKVGETVAVHNGCGGGGAKVSGMSVNYGTD